MQQLMAAAAPADAVTGQALAWQAALRRRGVGGEIYAEHVHPDLAGRVRPLAAFRPGDGAVLLRMSLWSAAVERAAEVPRERLGVVYHNITPAHLLERANPALAALCTRGRNALPDLARRVSVAIADSGYNAQELIEAGFPEPSVVPLLLPPPPAPPARDGAPAPVVLTVGRVSPSKRIEDAVRAVAVLRRLVPGARLEVVGGWEGDDRYRAALGRFAERLGVAGDVRFRGRVSDAERDRAYAEAGAYLCTSEHEGFCAPLVEALGRGLPVVARDAGAVAETLGGAGLVLPGRDAALAAEALACVLGEPEVRAELARRAGRRLAELAPDRVEAAMAAALAPLLA